MNRPVLTYPQTIVRYTLFFTPTRRYICAPSDDLASKYRGYYFPRVFILYCDAWGRIDFWQRIISCKGVLRDANAMARQPGWKRIVWGIDGYRAEPGEGPDLKLGECDLGVVLGRVYPTWRPDLT